MIKENIKKKLLSNLQNSTLSVQDYIIRQKNWLNRGKKNY